MSPLTLFLLAALIELEAREHQLGFELWRYWGRRTVTTGRLLPQDAGYYADEREFCPHCRGSTLD